MIENGPTIHNLNLIHDRAKTKKDGIYSFRGMAYRVEDGHFTHYAYGGQVVMRGGNFNYVMGRYSGYSDNAKKALKGI
jgi:hypothetical protein